MKIKIQIKMFTVLISKATSVPTPVIIELFFHHFSLLTFLIITIAIITIIIVIVIIIIILLPSSVRTGILISTAGKQFLIDTVPFISVGFVVRINYFSSARWKMGCQELWPCGVGSASGGGWILHDKWDPSSSDRTRENLRRFGSRPIFAPLPYPPNILTPQPAFPLPSRPRQ